MAARTLERRSTLPTSASNDVQPPRDGHNGRSGGPRSAADRRPRAHTSNLAARASRWSAEHWKTAAAIWLLFVAAAIAAGRIAGTQKQQRRSTTTRWAGTSPTPSSSPCPSPSRSAPRRDGRDAVRRVEDLHLDRDRDDHRRLHVAGRLADRAAGAPGNDRRPRRTRHPPGARRGAAASATAAEPPAARGCLVARHAHAAAGAERRATGVARLGVRLALVHALPGARGRLLAGLLLAFALPVFSIHTKLPSFTDLPKSLHIVRTYDTWCAPKERSPRNPGAGTGTWRSRAPAARSSSANGRVASR